MRFSHSTRSAIRRLLVLPPAVYSSNVCSALELERNSGMAEQVEHRTVSGISLLDAASNGFVWKVFHPG